MADQENPSNYCNSSRNYVSHYGTQLSRHHKTSESPQRKWLSWGKHFKHLSRYGKRINNFPYLIISRWTWTNYSSSGVTSSSLFNALWRLSQTQQHQPFSSGVEDVTGRNLIRDKLHHQRAVFNYDRHVWDKRLCLHLNFRKVMLKPRLSRTSPFVKSPLLLQVSTFLSSPYLYNSLYLFSIIPSYSPLSFLYFYLLSISFPFFLHISSFFDYHSFSVIFSISFPFLSSKPM